MFLVDFGAVRDTYHNTVTGGSTIVGTFGYMAPEQFRGQALLATDLYGLGTTLLFLLTGKSPADLPGRKLKIDFRRQVRVDKDFADWLETMVEPATEDRFCSAKEALAVLRGEQKLTSISAKRLRQPRYSPITLTKMEDRLVVDIPPVGLRSNHSRLLGLLSLIGTGASSISFLGLILFHDSGHNIDYFIDMPWWIKYIFLWPYYVTIAPLKVLFEKIVIDNIIISIAMLFLGFITIIIMYGIWVGSSMYLPIALVDLKNFVLAAGSRIRIEIDRDEFRLQQSFLGSLNKESYTRTKEIEGIELQGIKELKNPKPYTLCVVISNSYYRVISGRVKTHTDSFGFFLTQAEKEWLVGEINAFLENDLAE